MTHTGETTEETRFIAARAVSGFLFSLYLLAYTVVLMMYIRGVLRHLDNFFVSLRMPSLLVLETCCNIFVMAVVCLRQVAVEGGLEFPCALSKLAAHVMLTVFSFSYFTRSVKLVVAVDPALRKLYMKHLTSRNIHAAVVVVAGLCVLLWAGTWTAPFCHYRCKKKSCFPGSDWYLCLALVGLGLPPLLLVGRRLLQLKLADAQAMIVELLQGAQILSLGGSIYLMLVLLLDYKIISYSSWGVVVSSVMVIIVTLLFVSGGLVPAIRYGYDPFFARPDRVAMQATPSREMLVRMHTNMGLTGTLKRGSSSLNSTTNNLSSPLGADSSEARKLLGDLLEASETRALFVGYCRSAGCEEAVTYMLQFRSLAKEDLSPPNRQVFRQMAVDLVDGFLRPNSPHIVDLGSASLHADKLVHSIKLFKKRDVIFMDECVEALQALREVHDYLEKRLVCSVLPGFRQSMEYRAYLQLQATASNRRSSGEDPKKPAVNEQLQESARFFDQVMSHTSEGGAPSFIPPPPPSLADEDGEGAGVEGGCADVEGGGQLLLAGSTSSTPGTPTAAGSTSPVHHGGGPMSPHSLRRSRSHRKVSLVGQGSFNMGSADVAGLAAHLDGLDNHLNLSHNNSHGRGGADISDPTGTSSPRRRSGGDQEGGGQGGGTPSSPAGGGSGTSIGSDQPSTPVLGSRDLRRLSQMPRSQSASNLLRRSSSSLQHQGGGSQAIIVGSPVNGDGSPPSSGGSSSSSRSPSAAAAASDRRASHLARSRSGSLRVSSSPLHHEGGRDSPSSRDGGQQQQQQQPESATTGGGLRASSSSSSTPTAGSTPTTRRRPSPVSPRPVVVLQQQQQQQQPTTSGTGGTRMPNSSHLPALAVATTQYNGSSSSSSLSDHARGGGGGGTPPGGGGQDGSGSSSRRANSCSVGSTTSNNAGNDERRGSGGAGGGGSPRRSSGSPRRKLSSLQQQQPSPTPNVLPMEEPPPAGGAEGAGPAGWGDEQQPPPILAAVESLLSNSVNNNRLLTQEVIMEEEEEEHAHQQQQQQPTTTRQPPQQDYDETRRRSTRPRQQAPSTPTERQGGSNGS